MESTVTKGRCRVGTSGWTYAGWRGPFYPRDLPAKLWLAWYAEYFSTAEINGSFYRTPTLDAVQSWREQTPEQFVFAWKASKFITHWKRLTEKCQNSLELLETRLRVLEPKIGVVLFQLPPQFQANEERLKSFIKMLNRKRKYVFEFRHPSWYRSSIFNALRDKNVALCISDHYNAPAPWENTADFIYVRGHGPRGDYRDNYSERTLHRWARTIEEWQRLGREIYVFFDNDHKSAAPWDALQLQRLLSIETATAGL